MPSWMKERFFIFTKKYDAELFGMGIETEHSKHEKFDKLEQIYAAMIQGGYIPFKEDNNEA